MAGYTLIEKIIKNHSDGSDDEIYPDNIVWVDLDLVTARDYAGPQVIDLFEKNYQNTKTFDIIELYSLPIAILMVMILNMHWTKKSCEFSLKNIKSNLPILVQV